MKRLIQIALTAMFPVLMSAQEPYDNSTIAKFDLSRTPQQSDAVLGIVLEEAESRGYDTSKLIWVDQSLNSVIFEDL